MRKKEYKWAKCVIQAFSQMKNNQASTITSGNTGRFKSRAM